MVIKTDLSGFVVTMHYGVCEQYIKAFSLSTSWFDFLLHTPSCIVTSPEAVLIP